MLHHLQDENNETHEIIKNEIINLEKELDSIYDYRAKGAQIRARAEWIEQGEKKYQVLFGPGKKSTNQENCKKNYHNGRTDIDR